jgi:sulfide dehydrogenase cytochrome subunit
MANTPRNLALVAGALALGAAFATSAADEPPKPELVGGASATMLSETCAGCHGTDGLSAGPASPTIAGMNAEYFTETMKQFRDGKMYSTIMGRIAKGYTDQELESMAKFFAAKPYKPAVQEFDKALAAKGAKLHDKFCEKCHAEGGKPVKGEEEEFQILAGQWVPFLSYAMEDFREGRREIQKKMKSKLDDLLAKEGDAGLKALYAYYASQQ